MKGKPGTAKLPAESVKRRKGERYRWIRIF
nr:MAG TPA: hypothetical protein [Caudoviricetes sp.]DAZ27722.1 MAG TPA: hypothetical protein [Caudoviricetes sp.]